MTGEGVKRKQNDIGKQHQRTDADTKMSIKPEGANRVVPENDQKNESDVEKITMEVLQYQRESRFTAIFVRPGFAYGTSRGIKEERAVVSLAIVIAGGSKTEGRPKNQNRGREGPPTDFD